MTKLKEYLNYRKANILGNKLKKLFPLLRIKYIKHYEEYGDSTLEIVIPCYYNKENIGKVLGELIDLGIKYRLCFFGNNNDYDLELRIKVKK